jgi:hypothetical protein
MFCLLAGTAALLSLPALADGPPGSIVIRPGGSGATAERYPDKPGFLTIRPHHARGAASASDPPVIRIIRGKSAKAKAGAADEPGPPAPPPSRPAKPVGDPKKDGRVVLETWDACYLKGHKVGFFHVVVREYERDGKKYLYGTKTQKLTVSRFGQVVDQWAEDATMETPEGSVLVTRMRQGIGKDQMISLTGHVSGEKLSVKIEGAAGGTQEVPWPAGVVGIAKEATLLEDRKPKPGDTFNYLYYEGRLNRVIKFTATAKEVVEEPLVAGQKPRKLLKVELSMEPIGQFRLPNSTMWADAATFEPLKLVSDMPTLGGKMTVLRTTEQEASRRPTKVIELFDAQSIRLDREVAGIHDLAGVTYRVTVPGDLPADKLFARGPRQAIKNFDPAAKTCELQVTAVRRPGPVPAGAPADPGKEFLSSSFFLDWDNDLVKQHARAATANLPANASAWDKAKAVEAWVHRNMKATEFSQAMATCANVAKTLSGDCTEYAMLAAGMCRALGMPSRTALGLVYAPSRAGKPFLAYHMWYEVYADGQWVALDAVLGQGSVGPGHVKITDASWHEEKSFAPLLPVLTVLSAAPKFEVVRTTDARR